MISVPAAIYAFIKAVIFVGSAMIAADIINNAMEDDETGEGENCPVDNRQTPDEETLKDIIQEETLGGRKPLSDEDADTVLDWADELGIEGARDDRGKDHWRGGPHIHVPGSGLRHIPTGSR